MNAMASTAARKLTAPTAAAPQMTRLPARSSSCTNAKTAAAMGRRFITAFCRHVEDDA